MLKDVLGGLTEGGFKNKITQNEGASEQLGLELEEQRKAREEDTINNWRDNLRKENKEEGTIKYISIEQICLITIIYNIILINSDTDLLCQFLGLDNSIELSCLQYITFFRTNLKK